MNRLILIVAAAIGLSACSTDTARTRIKSPYENRQEVVTKDALGGTHRTVDIDRQSGHDDCMESTDGDRLYCDRLLTGFYEAPPLLAPPGVHQYEGTTSMSARYAATRASYGAPHVGAATPPPVVVVADPRTDAIVRQLGKTTEAVQQHETRLKELEGDSE